MYPVIPFPFAVEKQQRQTRPQDPIVLVLSPPWRTVLVLVIERFACMASTRLALRPITAVSQIADHAPYPISLSITKFLPEQRVDQDGMIQSHDGSIEREHEHEHEKQPEQNPCTEVAGRPCSILETTLAATR